jgi:acyl carrier protein
MAEVNEQPVLEVWPELPDPGMLDRIIAVIVAEGKVDPALIRPDATLDTLGLASMDVVMILMGLEDVLDAYIPMSTDLSKARNLAELVAAAVAAMKSQADGGAPAG